MSVVGDGVGESRPEVWRDDERARYVLELEGRAVGHATFRRRGERVLVVTHAEVDPAVSGRGLATLLVERMLADMRARGERLVPVCPFVAAYVEAHPDEADLVAAP